MNTSKYFHPFRVDDLFRGSPSIGHQRYRPSLVAWTKMGRRITKILPFVVTLSWPSLLLLNTESRSPPADNSSCSCIQGLCPCVLDLILPLRDCSGKSLRVRFCFRGLCEHSLFAFEVKIFGLLLQQAANSLVPAVTSCPTVSCSEC